MGERGKAATAIETVTEQTRRRKKNTYPHFHILLGRVWGERIREYMRVSPEQNGQHCARCPAWEGLLAAMETRARSGGQAQTKANCSHSPGTRRRK